MTLTLNRPWSNILIAHQLIILYICAEFFVNHTRGSTDLEQTQFRRDGQMERRIDKETKKMSPHYIVGDIIHLPVHATVGGFICMFKANYGQKLRV